MNDELEELVIKIRELPTVTQGKALIQAHTDKAVKEALLKARNNTYWGDGSPADIDNMIREIDPDYSWELQEGEE